MSGDRDETAVDPRRSLARAVAAAQRRRRLRLGLGLTAAAVLLEVLLRVLAMLIAG